MQSIDLQNSLLELRKDNFRYKMSLITLDCLCMIGKYSMKYTSYNLDYKKDNYFQRDNNQLNNLLHIGNFEVSQLSIQYNYLHIQNRMSKDQYIPYMFAWNYLDIIQQGKLYYNLEMYYLLDSYQIYKLNNKKLSLNMMNSYLYMLYRFYSDQQNLKDKYPYMFDCKDCYHWYKKHKMIVSCIFSKERNKMSKSNHLNWHM